MTFQEATYRKAAYDQGTAGSMDGTPALETLRPGVGARHGVCQELCGKWVRMMIRGNHKTPAARMKSLNTSRTMRKAIVRHMRHTPLRELRPKNRSDLLNTIARLKFGAKNSAASPRETVALIYGLVTDRSEVSVDWEAGISAMRDRQHLCSFVTVTIPDVGQHTMACRGGRFWVEFFDPNHGEYSIKSSDFATWFEDLANSYFIATPREKLQVNRFQNGVTDRSDRAIQRLAWQKSLNALRSMQAARTISYTSSTGIGLEKTIHSGNVTLTKDDLDLILSYYLEKHPSDFYGMALAVDGCLNEVEKSVLKRSMEEIQPDSDE